MKCPNCGYSDSAYSADSGQRYRQAINERLEDYGFPAEMNPDKYQIGAALRKIIQVRFGVMTRAGGAMSEEMADRGIVALDEILPKKVKP